MAHKNIFVFGLNEENHAFLKRVRHAEDYTFHRLLDRSELVERDDYDIPHLMEKVHARLKGFQGSVDGLIHYIDFPVSTTVPLLAREYGLPSASLEAVLCCEHKYWARVEQARVIPEACPPFAAFDPFDEGARERLEAEIGYPFWVKPIKSFSSYLGFRIDGPEDFERARRRLREEIGRFAEPFDYLLDHVDLPEAVRGVGGGHCLAEGIIGGEQCTLEGYGYQGEIHVYGVIDSVPEANGISFRRYQYPSALPESVQQRMIDQARRFMQHIGYDNAPFNIEFYWDRARDHVWLLEVNTRLSQSHCYLFEQVDGVSHQEVAVDLALGRAPEFPQRQGASPMAAKCFVRAFEDGKVTRVPTEAEVRALEQRHPGTRIEVHAREGAWLSRLWDQDSYSYCLALVFLGGENEKDIEARFEAIRDGLDFRIEKPEVA